MDAGFKPSLSNPSKLAKDPRIVARISELHSEVAKITAKATEKAAEALAIDREWIMRKLKENAERALQAIQAVGPDGQLGDFKYEGSVANRALELLGKEIGMFIERKDINLRHDLSSMSDGELEAMILAEQTEASSQTAH